MIRTMNQFTEAMRGTRRRIHAADLRALACSLMAFASLTVATFAPAASWNDDSHYVSLGPRSGYYIVRLGSPLSHQLGVLKTLLQSIAPILSATDTELTRSPSTSITPVSYPRRRLTSSKQSQMNFIFRGSVLSFAAGRHCATWKQSLADHRISNADPMVSSPTTRFRSITRSKILEEGDNIGAPQAFNPPSLTRE
jgi:hypothetical protein